MINVAAIRMQQFGVQFYQASLTASDIDKLVRFEVLSYGDNAQAPVRGSRPKADAPASKVAATRANGAEILTYNRLTEDREAIGRKIAAQTGATLVPPYDHPWTMAGQGTAALEFLEEAAPLDALVVCIGGGGLISGCSIAATSSRR